MALAPPPTVTALVDAICPGFPADSSGPAYPTASSVGVDRDVVEVIAQLPARQRQEFATLLRAVESPLTNLLLTGRPVRFTQLDPRAREKYLQGWAASRLGAKRRGFQAAKRLTTGLYYSQPFQNHSHPLWERIHYTPPSMVSAVPESLVGLGPTVPGPDSEFVADVCVIGSGAGGSVIASRAAEAGFRVVVLEAGEWYPDLAYPRIEKEAHDRLFLGRGIVTTSDTALAFLAGEAVGGSTAINWLTCLPPRPQARAEWARDGGMTDVATPAFDALLDEVGRRMSVSTAESTVNPSNDALRRGCLALGYRQGSDWEIIPRNAIGCRSRCGFCTFGCPYSARQSTLVTFLADAIRRGTRLLASTRADLIEVTSGRARGVRRRTAPTESPGRSTSEPLPSWSPPGPSKRPPSSCGRTSGLRASGSVSASTRPVRSPENSPTRSGRGKAIVVGLKPRYRREGSRAGRGAGSTPARRNRKGCPGWRRSPAPRTKNLSLMVRSCDPVIVRSYGASAANRSSSVSRLRISSALPPLTRTSAGRGRVL